MKRVLALRILRHTLLCFSLSVFVMYLVSQTVDQFVIVTLLHPSLFDLPLWSVLLLTSLIVGIVTGFRQVHDLKSEMNTIEGAIRSVSSTSKETIITYNGKNPKTKAIIDQIRTLNREFDQLNHRIEKVMSEKIETEEAQIKERIIQERHRLARELHDSVSQELFAVSMLVSALREMKEIDKSAMSKIEQMVQQAQLEMRALLLHLRPAALNEHTLHEGVEQLLAELKQKVHITIESRIESFHLSRIVEDHLFRILQESLSNALRHAKAERIQVSLIKRGNRAVLSIIDDGVGFDVDHEYSGSYGLRNMKERAEEIGAKFQLISVKNEGTKLNVDVEIRQVEE
ncbi:two-component system, NarL family, sensor histidine kinase LiaS [Pelagirhabdus alkalitolerans]|uniref:Sensor histidine kinase n=1 Tax=Pelagirhabdus alkalitolerans TaxID=1612202 RepID=A0A1G6GIT1_9BACI|nr:sensor histidine kinase [Pelagirhabdus alkalitolerans]SDB81840.1 two-component system, NarL family, sensor histidine kinase LiaS [Pelagirhabdus alkalitolerans]